MPRSGGGVYSLPAGTTVTSGTTIESSPYNAFLADLVSDLNAPRPIVAGGTGATSASAARTALGLAIGSDVQAFGAVLDDLNTLGANSADSEFLVGTGAGALAWESGATARTSLGLGALAVEGTVSTSLVDDNAITLAKQAGGTADRLQGFDGSGNPSEISISGTGLSLSSGTLTFTGGVLDKATTVTTFSNTSAEETVMTYTVPANTMGTDGIIRATLVGLFTNGTAGGRNFTLKIKFGGVTLYNDDTGNLSASDVSAVKIELLLSSNNSTSSQRLNAVVNYHEGSTAPTTGSTGIDSEGNEHAVAIRGIASSADTTSNQDLVITIQMSIASASLTFTKDMHLIEKL